MLPQVNSTKKVPCTSISDLDKVVEEIWNFSKGCRVWMLEGELGSGKTTLVKSLGRLMGVLDNITSPTFSIVNEYETTSGDIIYHFDFYRIRDLGEASALGLDEYLDSGRLCLIEWPEIVKRLLPEHNLQVRIETSRDDSRIFHLTRNE